MNDNCQLLPQNCQLPPDLDSEYLFGITRVMIELGDKTWRSPEEVVKENRLDYYSNPAVDSVRMNQQQHMNSISDIGRLSYWILSYYF